MADLSNPAKLGPHAGRTAWDFMGDGSIMTPGTIIISVDYINGGNVPSIRIRVWMSEPIGIITIIRLLIDLLMLTKMLRLNKSQTLACMVTLPSIL